MLHFNPIGPLLVLTRAGRQDEEPLNANLLIETKTSSLKRALGAHEFVFLIFVISHLEPSFLFPP